MNVNETLPRYTASMPLQAEFVMNADKSGDHVFTQVKREGNICLFKRSGLSDGRPKGYELFKVKVVKAGTKLPDGSAVAADYEQYPTGRMFGKSALNIGGMDAEVRADEMFTKWLVQPEVNSLNAETGEPKTRARKSVNDNAVYVIPDKEFTQADFATANGMPPRGKVYGVLQAQVTKGLVNSLGLRKAGKGRPTAFFVKAGEMTPAAV
jgi:hypothetical protein